MHMHNHCDHDPKYCGKCEMVYCTKCPKTWLDKAYPYYYGNNSFQGFLGTTQTSPKGGFTQVGSTGNNSLVGSSTSVSCSHPV
jgi:hypothetical protein